MKYIYIYTHILKRKSSDRWLPRTTFFTLLVKVSCSSLVLLFFCKSYFSFNFNIT